MAFFNRKNLFFVFSIILGINTAVLFAQNMNAAAANKKTAVRYLKIAQQYAASKNWKAADSNASLGISYDDTIADLWYIRALASKMEGVEKAKVLPLVEKALDDCQWVDYNQDNARVLCADVLCDTREFSKALDLLDSEPFLFSADAEYIRIKAFYNLNSEEYSQKAREKIDAARRIYPEDQRFAELFFRYEYAAGGRNDKNSKIADSFIAASSFYKKTSPELEVYCALFSNGEHKIRMLKSFNAKNRKTPLYAVAALKEGLISEDKALDYFYSFADKSIDLKILLDFARALKDPEAIREFGEYLNSYNGIIYSDTDGDLAFNLKVEYKRGRPEKVYYDENQDDVDDWFALCDFGVPYLVQISNFVPDISNDGQNMTENPNSINIEYASWPSISRVVYGRNEKNGDYKVCYNLVHEELLWTPFVVEPHEVIKGITGIDFFYPEINRQAANIYAVNLVKAASSCTFPSEERKGAEIRLSLLQGIPQMARYYVNNVMYAQTQFVDGKPALRTVDVDGDGLFETTETYGFTENIRQNVLSLEDEIQVLKNLFGEGIAGSGIYLKMIQVDTNGDTIPDFTEEYTEGRGKTSTWDTDNDGTWDTRYVKYASDAEGNLIEETLFHQPLSGEVVSVQLKNGVPVKVTEGDTAILVAKSEDLDLFWIGSEGTKEDGLLILKKVNRSTPQGICCLVEGKHGRFMAVRIGKYIFGKLLPEEKVSLEKVENEN